jgi:micrococcal nuclease
MAIIQDNYVRHIYAIEDIYDGDTITAIVELGYDVLGRAKFRFLGINTAEMKSVKSSQRYKLAQQAKTYVEEILKNHKVRVESTKFKEDSFGRYLGTMFYEKDGEWVNLNQELIEKGLAEIYYKGASKNYGEFNNKKG